MATTSVLVSPWLGRTKALRFKLAFIGDEPIDAVSNTTLIAGDAVRAEPRRTASIGKNNLDPLQQAADAAVMFRADTHAGISARSVGDGAASAPHAVAASKVLVPPRVIPVHAGCTTNNQQEISR